MALKAAIIMSVISIVMLAIYGADSIMAINENLGVQNTAFLNIDVKTRGAIFGIIPAAMLVISFFITRKESSRGLGSLIIIGGVLMILGVAIIFALQGNAIPSEGKREFGAVVGIGIIIAILGGIKIKKSR
ncbi:MAG TPA: hypothetical protein VEU72_05370 [Nitrosopumilaceae archaeon]|nr:hypothetical protein [Nitrosopumilaceae archaeon]